jgi:hypothetical protein
MRDEYGENSNAYRVRVLGEFPLVGDASVIPLAMIEAAVNRDVEPTMHSVVWGVDIARYGDDRCALVKRRGNTVLEPAKFGANRTPCIRSVSLRGNSLKRPITSGRHPLMST